MTRSIILATYLILVCGFGFAETEFEKLDRSFSQKKARENLELNALYLTKLAEIKQRSNSGAEVVQIDKRIEALKEENRQYQTQLSSSFNLTGKAAQVRTEGEFVPFAVGEKMIRSKKHTWLEIPADFSSGYQMSFVYAKNSILKFSVTSAGLVTLACGTLDSTDLLKDGWKEVDTAIRKAVSGKTEVGIYQKYLNAGDYSIPNSGALGVRLLLKQ